jgi:hypothetical protein
MAIHGVSDTNDSLAGSLTATFAIAASGLIHRGAERDITNSGGAALLADP